MQAAVEEPDISDDCAEKTAAANAIWRCGTVDALTDVRARLAIGMASVGPKRIQ
jgi:hypothetical protein